MDDELSFPDMIEGMVTELSSVNGRHRAVVNDGEDTHWQLTLDDASFAHACRAMMYGRKVRVHHMLAVVE